MTSYLFIVLIIMLATLAGLSGLVRDKNKSLIVPKPILTENEIEFLHRLQRALPEYHVFPQVALGAILDATNEKGRLAKRGKFSQKIADYVVCERMTMTILAIIELDDKTHNKRKDQERDAMLGAAGYRVIRFQSKRKPSEAEISHYFRPTLPETSPAIF